MALLSQDRQATIGGQSFTLRFSTKALASLKDLWGVKTNREVLAKIDEQTSGLNIDTVVDLLWAAMRRHHRDVTREQVDDLLDDAGPVALSGVVVDLNTALAASMPPPSEVAETRPPKAKAKA